MEQYYSYSIEVDEEKIIDIFREIEQARRTIYDAYRELGKLGVVKLKRATTDGDPDNN